MHKLFSILFLLVFVSISYSQPVVDIPLTGSDGTITINMAVGLDPSATNGIDPALGESDLPPFPPAGAFEIRFDLTPYAGEPLSTYKDYRFAASFPYSGQVEHKLIWQLSAPGLPLDIGYDIPAEATMTIMDELGGIVFNSGPLTGVGTYQITAPLTAALVTMDYTAVPVELTSFVGTVQDNGVLLNWSTATELNNQGFEIERSSSNQEWAKIGYVPGFGTTTEPRAYSYMDNDVDAGTYFYRLKQLDFSGAFEYSDEIEVVVDFTPQSFELHQNYPNPFNPSTTIQFQVPEASDVSIVIYDMLGQEVRILFSENIQAGAYSVDWNGVNNAGQKMSSGSYIYRMTAGDYVDTKEMILLK
jgi:hypothetical protein